MAAIERPRALKKQVTERHQPLLMADHRHLDTDAMIGGLGLGLWLGLGLGLGLWLGLSLVSKIAQQMIKRIIGLAQEAMRLQARRVVFLVHRSLGITDAD
jgi:hypothetical protein